MANELLMAVAGGRREEVYRGVREVYASLEAEILARRPRCDASGRCCHFEEFGHRLYVTTAELALFVHELGGRGGERGGERGTAEGARSRRSLPVIGGCQYQVEGLCSVHALRPFGCRVFFCDPTVGAVGGAAGGAGGGDGWMERMYERHHGRLRQLHEELGVSYLYVEWRSGLAELGLLGSGL